MQKNMTWITTIFPKVKRFIDKRVEDFGAQYIAFGIFGIINYPASYFMWHNVNTQAYESLTLRLIASFLCVPLALKNYLPYTLRSYLPTWWYLTIMYSLPFFGTFMLLKNHASTGWLMNAVLGIFLLVLIVDWISFAILIVVGMGLGFLYFKFTTPAPYYISSDNVSLAIYMYIFAIIIGGIFSRNKQVLEKQKLQVIESVGASIAHELRTPLRTIESSASGIKKYLPQLIEAYQIAKDAQLDIPYITPPHYKALLPALYSIEAEVQSSFNFIKMLLINVNPEKIIDEKEAVCSIAECVNEALRRYPFDLGEKELIHWEDKNGFYFKGNQELIIHVLFNLLKNALYYIKAAGRGEIKIWFELGIKVNRLHFKDTGTGIPQNILRHIFNRFFTKTPHGTGIGLAFCKLVMQRFNGNIACISEENKFTEFVLSFPREPALNTPMIVQ